ncbi:MULTISPECIES: hypothetical protein [Staphylococcus]|uniref:Mid2-like cell wall stress sensor domain protein n=1 Tax=Staphylococcus hsinchuensis TaxID=3051183 RepID=A0ABZ3EFJ7_9STAP|nr:hypothetical protein [Staphylococcus sp. Marseille-Q6910]
MDIVLTIVGIGAFLFAMLALGFWIMPFFSNGNKSSTTINVFAVLAIICVVILIVGSNL